MKTDIEQILSNIRIAYEYEMGEYLEPANRQRSKVELRNALVNAARPYGTHRQLAEMVGKTNHTTTIHITREHEVYHNYSPQYRRNYAVALQVVEKFARRHGLLPRINGQGSGSSTIEEEIDSINLTILSLQKRRDGFVEKLHERRKSSTFDTQSTI
jgi:hypothetical protein